MKIYLIKVALCDVSPMVWRRLRVPGTASLAMLHECIQIINRWDEFHLHQFHIYGKDYGINYDGGLYYADNAHAVCIDDFNFEIGDKFTYEYNFFEHIMHDIRIEKITDSLATKNSISCISGSGMPGATKQDVTHVEFEMLKKLVKKKWKLSYADIQEFQDNIHRVKFSKKYINKGLAALSNA